MTAPTNGQIFKLGDNVKVQADLYDPDTLLGEYLTVVSGKNYSDTIIKFEDHTYGSSYTLSKQFFIQTKDTIKIIVGAYGGSSITVEKEVYKCTINSGNKPFISQAIHGFVGYA